MNPALLFLSIFAVASADAAPAPTRRKRRRRKTGDDDGDDKGPQARTETSTRDGSETPVGTSVNTGYGPPVTLDAFYMADFRPSSGEYDSTEVGGINFFGVEIEKRPVPLGFPKNHIPADDFAAEVYTGNTALKIQATVQLSPAHLINFTGTREETNKAKHDLTGPRSLYRYPCLQTEYFGAVGSKVGVSDVPLVALWKAGSGKTLSGAPLGPGEKAMYGWTDQCAFAVGENIPRLSVATFDGGARRVVLSLWAARSTVRIDVQLKIWAKRPG